MRSIAVVTADHLNVRAEPHENAKIVAVLDKGDRREVLDRREFNGGRYVWLKLAFGDSREGWVDARFAEVRQAPPDVPPPPAPAPELSLPIAQIVGWAAAIAVVVFVMLILASR